MFKVEVLWSFRKPDKWNHEIIYETFFSYKYFLLLRIKAKSFLNHSLGCQEVQPRSNWVKQDFINKNINYSILNNKLIFKLSTQKILNKTSFVLYLEKTKSHNI